MSDERDPSAAFFLLARMWMDIYARMAASAMTSMSDATPPEAIRQMRSPIFSTMSEYTEEYLRSPEFLDSMKQSLDAVVAWRKQFNDACTQFHHGVQGVSQEDISNLMMMVQHLEKRMLDRLDTLSVRLEEVSLRLANGQSGAAGPRRKRGTAAGKANKPDTREQNG